MDRATCLSSIEKGTYFIVNAFTQNEEGGNPAAVILLGGDVHHWPSDTWLVEKAKAFRDERCDSPTRVVFVLISEDDGTTRRHGIRWFSRAGVETDFCGHGTLCASFVLHSCCGEQHTAKTRDEGSKKFEYDTRAGTLIAVVKGNTVTMTLPWVTISNTVEDPVKMETTHSLCSSILFPTMEPVENVPNCFEYIGTTSIADTLIVLPNEELVWNLQPNLVKVSELGGRGLIVTAETPKSSKNDFVSRFFDGRFQVEDHVTGSTHCALGPFWHERWGDLNRTRFNAFQASKRGGVLDIELINTVDVNNRKVVISGDAVIVLKGYLNLL